MFLDLLTAFDQKSISQFMDPSTKQPFSFIIRFPFKEPSTEIMLSATYSHANNFISSNTMQKMSIVSAELIRNHLANTSPTKIAHVFSKSKRFFSPNPECRQAFYGQSKSQLSKKKTVFGTAKRYDFTKTPTETPASCTYKMRSEFSRMNRTFTFGVSRDQSPERSYLYRFMKTVIPGPGSYENQVKTRSSISYTHRAKTIDVVAKHLSFLETPSPNQYNSVDLNPKNGKFRVSKFADAKYSVINKSKRFAEYKEKTPAPNAYKTIDDLNDKGKFVLSQRRGKGTRPFDREMKFTVGYWKTNENPGPSDYEKPSQFGVYGDSQYYKTLRQTG